MNDIYITALDTLSLGDLVFAIDPAGALFEKTEKLLVVSDLHLEKGSAFAKRGSLLPPYDTHDTLLRLEALLEKTQAATVISLGDTWHDGLGERRMNPSDRAIFESLRKRAKWIWITGNHDPDPHSLEHEMIAENVLIKGVYFRHVPSVDHNDPEISGHLHPVAKIRLRGQSVRRKCFISNQHRCILPAFGAYTGGLNIMDYAFAPLFPGHDFVVRMLSAGKVYQIGRPSLVMD
jgi:uncharacterized protein